ncbi:MAG: hypothetical protein BMS9Abin05_1347 [Rhodothermia bacterium]|nr:MAG: hypothetical protein BMS9Abin05_1347 [Rhodothermia bacterium]
MHNETGIKHESDQMKVRITNNRIRLRLSPEGVEALARGDGLETHIDSGAGGKLGFYLTSESTIDEISLALDRGILQIAVPEQVVTTWADTDQVGIEGLVSTVEGNSVGVLIEKDLRCEHAKRS